MPVAEYILAPYMGNLPVAFHVLAMAAFSSAVFTASSAPRQSVQPLFPDRPTRYLHNRGIVRGLCDSNTVMTESIVIWLHPTVIASDSRELLLAEDYGQVIAVEHERTET